MVEKIQNAIKKFDLNLKGKVVLTEAASGNYVVTSIIAAASGATVYAMTTKSEYASIQEVIEQTLTLAKQFNIEDKIHFIYDKHNLRDKNINIVTNTGFVRPINKELIEQLSSQCVIPLMWEPWEFRNEEIDLEYCFKKGIKVYGTNEKDLKLQTMQYIGLTVLSFLLQNKMTPFSTKVLILGNVHFSNPIIAVLKSIGYQYLHLNTYNKTMNISTFQAIVFAEHEDDTLLLGDNGFIQKAELSHMHYLIHICGNVDFNNIHCKVNTTSPARFGYMSFTTDYIDSQAVIDLHTAGLKVGEGMLQANALALKGEEYKNFMEKNYPALAFKNKKFW